MHGCMHGCIDGLMHECMHGCMDASQQLDGSLAHSQARTVGRPRTVSGASKLYVLSWNVTGLAAGSLDLFLQHVSAYHDWDAIMIQEGFHSLEPIVAGQHFVFTPPGVCSGVACPAIILHKRWDGHTRQLAGGSH